MKGIVDYVVDNLIEQLTHQPSNRSINYPINQIQSTMIRQGIKISEEICCFGEFKSGGWRYTKLNAQQTTAGSLERVALTKQSIMERHF